jgi:CDP-diacylglycerol--serine O-phosphatidyltransferase
MFSPFHPKSVLRSWLPTCFTLSSMFCGYLSVTFTLKGSFLVAAWLIVAGGILDACDGLLARALHSNSAFGGEVDSFADLISFGLAPSLLIYRVYFSHWGIVGLGLGFLPTMMTAVRLSRYNLGLTSSTREYFGGFTSTANGALLASFVLFAHGLPRQDLFPYVAAALIVVSCVLMVSGVPYMTIGKYTGGGVWKTKQGALWMPVWFIVALFPERAFFPAMLTLMLQGPLAPRIEQMVHHVHGIRRHAGARG